MPKAEKGTPKDIANRMKAKGLQKLKFYCQMCAKQCRDENGFKCHMTSDSHLRQMKIFRENAGGMMDSFSKEFEVSYMETLRRRHGTQRMNANNVYQEVIQDKHHVHMNSTKWATLTDFVQYLGKKGLCVVEETERGWYVTYIERDPALLARQEAVRKKTEADKREERREAERREMLRVEAAKALDRAGCEIDLKASEIGDRDEDEKMEMKLGSTLVEKKKKPKSRGKISLLEEDDDDVDNDNDGREDGKEGAENGNSAAALGSTKNFSVSAKTSNDARSKMSRGVEEPKKYASSKRDRDQHTTILTEATKNDAKRHKSSSRKNDDDDDKRKDYWLYRNILVRIISKKLANGTYYKRKAIVLEVIDKYQAEIEVLESAYKACDGGDILQIDQDDLETVIPKMNHSGGGKDKGEKVRIVNGRYRGRKARVEWLDKRKCCAELRLLAGGKGKKEEGGGGKNYGHDDDDDDDDGSVVVLDYEDFSMIA